MSWYVITAGPSAGKTSVINELAARGYRVAPEGARIVLDQLVSEDIDPKEFRTENPQQFQSMVIETDIRIQSNTPTDETVFFDRSVLDNYAYASLTDRDVPPEIGDEYGDAFDSVFRLEQIPFEDDYARTEDESMADRVHDELGTVYEEHGYSVIDVNLMPVNRRADFIEHCVENTVPAIH